MNLENNPLTLEQKLKTLPSSPGVYIFKDSSGNIIYIGKASVLRNRVRQYFQSRHDGRYQFDALVSRIADVECIATHNELEALMLENNLIKQEKPRYNVDLKDDKSFPFLRITNEEFPRIFLTRKPVSDGSKYYGPYSDLFQLKGLLHALRGMLQIRTCNLPLAEATIAKKKFKSCLEYHIGRCNAPCIANETREDYHKRVKDFTDVILGRGSVVLQRLHEEMEQFAGQLKFERAAQLRDWISAVDDLTQNQKVISAEPIERDIFGIAAEDDSGCVVIMQVRAGRMLGRLHYRLRQVSGQPVEEILGDVVQMYYGGTATIPAEVVLPFDLPEKKVMGGWLSRIADRKVEIRVPERGQRAQFVDLAMKNAEMLLVEAKIAAEARDRTPSSLKELEQRLALTAPPKVIVCFDISNLMGTDQVASMVVFENGRPARSQYRRYQIRSVTGPDDYASMREIVTRRFSRLQSEERPFPNLVIIDGGKGQLAAAVEALTQLGIVDLPIIGLAKRLEEVFKPHDSQPQNFPKTSSALRLMQQVRDEAHRFAITYHRKLRQKRTLLSLLDEIEGVGPARRKLLLQHFGSMAKLEQASLAEIESVQGLPLAVARQVHEFFLKRNEDRTSDS